MAGYDLVPTVFLSAKGNGCDDAALPDALDELEHVFIVLDLERVVREVVDFR